jgi:hypothetical protein
MTASVRSALLSMRRVCAAPLRPAYSPLIDVEFSILGPLEVCRDGRPVTVAGAKVRALLALLVLHAGEPMSAERLAIGL